MMRTKILVTGGAGYIGSHTVRKLLENDFDVVVYDNLSTGTMASVPGEATMVVGDVRDRARLAETLKIHQIDCVIHFAALLQVAESILNPHLYYDNNVGGSISLLRACVENNIKKIVFSSTAAVYGDSSGIDLVTEASPTGPLNPYGHSKLIVEGLLRDGQRAYGLNYVALRYFNVAGAAVDGRNGQRTAAASHLVKVASQAALGGPSSFQVFGNDYPTFDGTCIRDYIHVEDLAQMHVLAVKYLQEGGASEVMNCGYGRGFSVLDVVKTMQKVSSVEFPVSFGPRRVGDATQLVANATKARALLNWRPQYDDLELICKTAYDWEAKMSLASLRLASSPGLTRISCQEDN